MALLENIENETEKISSITLDCRDMDSGSSYGTGIEAPRQRISI